MPFSPELNSEVALLMKNRCYSEGYGFTCEDNYVS
tara:strand:- start:692 stop:796 length:105 start_codon:yes stop_codon:yes gene_type:complete